MLVVDELVVGVLDDVVLVDEPAVLVGVVAVLGDPLEPEVEVWLEDPGLVEGALLELVLVVEVPAEVEELLDGVAEDEVLLGGLAIRPLWFSSFSTSCWTVVTWEMTALGVPLAPSVGSAFSCLRDC